MNAPKPNRTPPPDTRGAFFVLCRGLAAPPDPSAAHERGRVRSGLHELSPTVRTRWTVWGARRWQVRALIRVPGEAWCAGASGASRTAYLPTERVKRATIEAKNKSWVLRYIVTFGASSRTHARTHAHSQIAREFVGCLSDKLKKSVDKVGKICYIVVSF